MTYNFSWAKLFLALKEVSIKNAYSWMWTATEYWYSGNIDNWLEKAMFAIFVCEALSIFSTYLYRQKIRTHTFILENIGFSVRTTS